MFPVAEHVVVIQRLPAETNDGGFSLVESLRYFLCDGSHVVFRRVVFQSPLPDTFLVRLPTSRYEQRMRGEKSTLGLTNDAEKPARLFIKRMVSASDLSW